MKYLERITLDSQVMGGKPCIRGMRVTVSTLVGLLAVGHSVEEILNAYPYLEKEDITEALSYAAWRSAEVEVSLSLGELFANSALRGVSQSVETSSDEIVNSALRGVSQSVETSSEEVEVALVSA
jgi:uncharacterized protein (DUF433 family)